MIRVIRGHNRLNGFRFSSVEFGLVGLDAVVLAAYFVLSAPISSASSLSASQPTAVRSCC